MTFSSFTIDKVTWQVSKWYIVLCWNSTNYTSLLQAENLNFINRHIWQKNTQYVSRYKVIMY